MDEDSINWGRKARRRWPRSGVEGNGRYAVVTCAFFHPSARQMCYSDVFLFPTLEEAQQKQDTVYCHAHTKGRCRGKHEIVDMGTWRKR